MEPRLTWEAVQSMAAEGRRQAEGAPRQEPARKRTVPEATITVRFATPSDADALERLAALDSKSVPVGSALVAELDGELVAALPIRYGVALADPFRPTAELVRLLELRRAQLRGRDRRGRRAKRRRPDRRRGATAAARP